MILVLGYSFSCQVAYPHKIKPDGISGWNLVNIVMPPLLQKLEQKYSIFFNLVHYDFIGKNEDEGKYCLVLKTYLDNNCSGDEIEIPVKSLLYDLSNLEGNNLLSYYHQLLRECGLTNVEQYHPKILVF